MQNKNIITLSKTFRWEMAHRLPFHTSGCQNIHGHSYLMEVCIRGVPDSKGMLMDYGELKSIVKPLIDELDHAFLCAESDTVCAAFLRQNRFKAVFVPFETTSENLVFYLLEKIRTRLQPYDRIHQLKLILRETTTSSAEAECLIHE